MNFQKVQISKLLGVPGVPGTPGTLGVSGALVLCLCAGQLQLTILVTL